MNLLCLGSSGGSTTLEAAINRALLLDPNNTLAHQHAAHNQLSMGELEQGIKHLVKTIDQASEDTSVELNLSKRYNEFGYQDKAHQWATVQNHPLTHITLALSATDIIQMHKHLNQAKQLLQDPKQYFNEIAQVYYQQAQFNSLAEHVKKHLYTDEGILNTAHSQQSLFWAGMVNIHNQQYLPAIKIFERQLAQYKSRSDNPNEQIKLSNLLAYCYKKLNNNNKMTTMLKRSKRVQSDLIRNGLKSPTFVIEMVAYYTIADEQTKADQLLRNASSKGWKLKSYIQSNPIFELLSTRQQYIIQ